MAGKAGLLVLSIAIVLSAGCDNKSPEEKAAEDVAKRMEEVGTKMEEAGKKMEQAGKTGGEGMAEAMAAMGAALGTATTGGKTVETVDFRELKALLPASLRGMKRTDATGQKNAAMGMQISTAEGRYSSEDGKSVTLKITDIGSMSGLAGMATYAWASTEVDRESETGYEKSTTFNGFKAMEKYDKQSQSGEMSVMVGGRFVVEADGNNVDMEAIKSALGSVDLRKLDGMKGKGVQ